MAWLLIYMFLMLGIVASFDDIFRNVLIKRSKRCKYPEMSAYIADCLVGKVLRFDC